MPDTSNLEGVPLGQDWRLDAWAQNIAFLGQSLAAMPPDAHVEALGLHWAPILDELFKQTWGLYRNITAADYARMVTELTRRMGGELTARVLRQSQVQVEVQVCPFGQKGPGNPQICRLHSSLFGGMARRNFGYGKVVALQSIAQGADSCRITIYLRETNTARRHPAIDYSQEALALNDALSQRLALVGSVPQLANEMVNTNRRLAAINQMASTVGASLETADILQGVIQRSMEALAADSAAVMLLDEETKELTPVASQGLSEEFIADYTQRKLKVGKGVNGRVVAAGEPIIVADAPKDRRIRRSLMEKEGLRSFVVVPLRGRQGIIGTLSVGHRQRHRYGSDEMELLAALADIAGLALDNARHFEQQRQRAEALEAVRQMAQALGAELELPKVLEMALSYACQLTGATSGGLMLWDEEAQLLRHSATFNLPDELASRPVPLGQGIAGNVALTRKPLLVNRYRRYPRKLPWLTQDSSVMGVPIIFGAQLLGVLNVGDFALQRRFTSHGLQLLELFAAHAAIAIYKAKLLEQQREAVTRLQLLHEASTAFSRSLDLEETLSTIVAHTGCTLDLEVCLIRMTEPGGLWRDRAAYFASAELEERFKQVAADFPVTGDEGVGGAAVAQGATVLVEDCTTEPRIPPPYRALFEPGTRLLVAPVPLRQGPRAIMSFHSHPQKRRLSQADFPFTTSLAEIAGAAIDRALAYAKEQRRAAQVSSLLRIAEDINSQLDMTQLLRRIAQQAMEITDARASFVALEEEGQTMMWEWWDGQSWHADVHAWSKGESGAGWVWQTGEPYLSNDAANDPHATPEVMATYRLRSFIIVPILNRWGEFLGVVTVTNKKRRAPFDEEDVSLLEGLARQAAVAIENARLFRNVGEIEALKELNRLKDEFVATASHELRTPLVPLVGYSELLATRDLSPQEVKRMATLLNQEAQRISRMVEELLDLAHLEQGGLRLDRQPTIIGELLGEAALAASPKSGRHHVQVKLEEDLPPLSVDRVRIRQVLDNLVTNAIKYSPGGGHVALSARTEPGGIITISVSDEGIGIPAKELDKVFDKFYRVDNPVTRRVRGTGLGLPICRDIVEAHGGRMWVHSKVGAGSTFSFTLPVPGPQG